VRRHLFVILPLCAILLFACAQEEPERLRSTFVKVIPQPGEGVNLVQSQGAEQIGQSAPPPTLYTSIPDTYVVTNVINHNLDRDSTIEQFVFYRELSREEYIQLLVIDYDRRRNSYIRAWESPTDIQSAASLDVSFLDITKDGREEIIMYGQNQNGDFVLNIFTPRFDSVEATVTLQKIGVFTSQSEIGIREGTSILSSLLVEEAVRAQQIIITEQLTEHESIAAREESDDGDESSSATAESDALSYAQLRVYEWSAAAERFEFLVTPIRANPELDQELVRQLTQISAYDLLEIVAGSWIMEGVEHNAIMIIDAEEKRIDIQINQRQAAFQWKGEFKTITQGLPTIQLTLLNEYFPVLSTRGAITLLDMDSVRINILEELDMSGTYQRSEIAHSRTPPIFLDDNIVLRGWYEGRRDERAVALYFDRSRYILEEPPKRTEGNFVIYALDERIVEFVEQGDAAQEDSYAQYLLEYQREREEKRVINTLLLTPIALRADGYELLDEAPVALTQTITTSR